MEHWTTSVVKARTTIPWEGSGDTCDVVTGLGATPELAVTALHANAEETAHRIGQQTAELIDAAVIAKEEERQRRQGEDQLETLITRREEPVTWRDIIENTSWKFEVIDVRLTPGPIEGGSSGWLAYRTLSWASYRPRELL